jgi:predicted nucleic acid-binding protein
VLLVDSTVYMDLIRSGRDPVATLAPWVETGQLLCCGIIRCEVLRGIRTPGILARMRELFEIVVDVPLTAEIWRQTGDLAWGLDRAGTALPLTDLAIASCARSRDADLVTSDPHFQRIPGLRVSAAIPATRQEELQ